MHLHGRSQDKKIVGGGGGGGGVGGVMYMYRKKSAKGVWEGMSTLPREARKLRSVVHRGPSLIYLFVVRAQTPPASKAKGGLALKLCEYSNVYIHNETKFSVYWPNTVWRLELTIIMAYKLVSLPLREGLAYLCLLYNHLEIPDGDVLTSCWP